MQLTNETGKVGGGELIPTGTLAFATFHVQAVTLTKETGARMASLELTLSTGPYARRKVFTYLMDPDDAKHKEDSRLRAQGELARMLEAAGICQAANPSSYARITSFEQALQELTAATAAGKPIAIKVGLSKGKNGYEDKNNVGSYLSPNPNGDSFRSWSGLLAGTSANGATTGSVGVAMPGFGAPAAQPAAPAASGFGAPRAAALAAPGWIGGGTVAPPPPAAPAALDDEIPF